MSGVLMDRSFISLILLGSIGCLRELKIDFLVNGLDQTILKFLTYILQMELKEWRMKKMNWIRLRMKLNKIEFIFTYLLSIKYIKYISMKNNLKCLNSFWTFCFCFSCRLLFTYRFLYFSSRNFCFFSFTSTYFFFTFTFNKRLLSWFLLFHS